MNTKQAKFVAEKLDSGEYPYSLFLLDMTPEEAVFILRLWEQKELELSQATQEELEILAKTE